MATENGDRDAVVAEGDETPGNIPVRWATPEPKKTLRKQTTRLTIIDEPTEIVTLDDDESTTSISESKTLWNGLCSRCACSWTELDRNQKRFLMQGVMVRVILTAHSFFILYAALVHLHMAVYICVCFLYAALSIAEGIIMYKIRGFSQKKWICTSTLLYTVCVIPATWALHMSMLRVREKHGYENCLQNYNSCQSNQAYDQVMHNASTRSFVVTTYSDYERLTMTIEYTIVFVLIFCRWLIPRDNFTREKVAQLLLVLVGSGEDIVEFITVIFSSEHFGCSRAITVVVLLLWSIAIFQFSIAIPEKKNKVHVEKPENAILDVWVNAVNQLLAKRRETVGDVSLYVAKKQIRPLSRMMQRRKTVPNIGRNDWVQSTEFREAIISITIQDGPFLIFRIVILAILGDAAFSVFFYALKNLTVIMLQIYRVYAMLVEFRQRRRESLFTANTNDAANDVENNNLEKSESASLDEVSEILAMNEKAFTYAVDEEMNVETGSGGDTLTSESQMVQDDPHGNNSTKVGNVKRGLERAPVMLPSSSETDLRTRRQSKTSDNPQK